MQTYQVTVIVDNVSRTFEVNIDDQNFCDLVQKAGMTDPEQHDDAVCDLAADTLIQMFAELE